MNKDIKKALVFGIVGAIIIFLIFLPGMKEREKMDREYQKEQNLINAGKIISDETVINEVVEVLKNRNKEQLQKYLANDFEYFDKDNHKSLYTDSFWSDLQYLVGGYEIEKRGNSVKNQETYRIYWNVIEENENLDRTSDYYCLQKLTVVLNRIVKKDIITYEITQITLKGN